jgi:hypothetical protein
MNVPKYSNSTYIATVNNIVKKKLLNNSKKLLKLPNKLRSRVELRGYFS